MKALKLHTLLIAIFAFVALSIKLDPKYSFEDFLKQFNKNYEEAQKSQHETAFEKNYAELIRLQDEGHDVSVNERLDWTDEQFSNFFSPTPQYTPTQSKQVKTNGLAPPPSSFDWRAYNRVTPVKDTGTECMSNWAFAATDLYESMLAIATKGTLYDLAEQYAFDCNQALWDIRCYSAYSFDAFNFIAQTGVPLQSSYQYNKSYHYAGLCENKTPRIKINQTYYLQYLVDPSIEEIQQHLVTFGPLGVTVTENDPAFYFVGSSGLVSCSANSTQPAAIPVLLIGYNTTHWFIKNAWGTGWGDNGYAYISKDNNHDCGISQLLQVMILNINFPANDTGNLNLMVTLTDTYGDGWNGNILGIKQNNSIVAVIGDKFTDGDSSGPFYFNVKGNIEARIVVLTLGADTIEIGFTIRARISGDIIHQRAPGNKFSALSIFSTFCPIWGCIPATEYTVTLSDTFGDGWNGNVFGFRQNSTIVATFGDKFTTGKIYGPFIITAFAPYDIQIVLTKLGTKTDQVGFMVKAPNGALVYQRVPSTFTASTYFTTFCIETTCPNNLELTITMSDSGSDGWNSNVLGIRQNNVIVTRFGNKFTSGASSGPLYVFVKQNQNVQIVVVNLGLKTNEIGFVVKAPNGTIVAQRIGGTEIFPAGIIMASFCPVDGCPYSPQITVNVMLNDSFGDGWNGNVLAVRQNNIAVAYLGLTFTTGSTLGPTPIIIHGNTATQIFVYALGSKTNEIGFNIAGPSGAFINERAKGTLFSATSILSIFCPMGQCANLVTLTINLTSLDSDGWNGNIMGIRQFNQNNAVVGTFGADFTEGSLFNTYITVMSNYQTQIFVSTLGTKTDKLGFTIQDKNGAFLASWTAGLAFDLTSNFGVFCPGEECPTPTSSILTITMSDTVGDGWNGNVIAIMQDNIILGTFGETFTFGSIYIPVQNSKYTKIFCKQLGNGTNEIGFTVKSPNGTVIYQKNPGTRFYPDTVFKTFHIDATPTLNLTINIMQPNASYWNGNAIVLKQKGVIVGGFGSTTTTVGSMDPLPNTVNIVVQANSYFQVVAIKASASPNDVSFTIVAPNGTIIYRRNPGWGFWNNMVFITLCPMSCPAPNPTLNLIIFMKTIGSNWNKNLIAIRQKGVIVGTFGSTYINNTVPPPVNIIIQSNSYFQVVAVNAVLKTQEIGFQIIASNMTTMFQRFSGSPFSSNTIFATICPTQCQPLNTTYYLSVTDIAGDGWQGTVLGFVTNGVLRYTFTLTYGFINNQIPYSFALHARVNIVVYTLGGYTNQISFNIKNAAGWIIFSRKSGQKFSVNSILGTFCVECPSSTVSASSSSNPSEISYQPSTQSTSPSPQAPTPEQKSNESNYPVNNPTSDSSNNPTNDPTKNPPNPLQPEHTAQPFKIATYILAPLLGIALVIIIGCILFIVKLKRQLSRYVAQAKLGDQVKTQIQTAQSIKTKGKEVM